MLNFIDEIPIIWAALYCSLFFVGVTWFGIIFIKPFLRLLMGREPRINELVAQASAGFSVFYGLLLGLLAVAAYVISRMGGAAGTVATGPADAEAAGASAA